jgi:hypothetical protein
VPPKVQKSERRTVIGSANVRHGHVGRQKLWAYAIEDFAKLFGMTVEATRKAIQRKTFDPRDLSSVLEFAKRRRIESHEDAVPLVSPGEK